MMKELGWLVGLSPDQIACYEHDRHTPRLGVCVRLCAALETSAEDLLGLTTSEEKDRAIR